MKILLKTTLVTLFLALLYALVGYSSTPAYAATYNCALRTDGYCDAQSDTCTPSPNPCLPKSPTACSSTTYTCSDEETTPCPSGTAYWGTASLCADECSVDCTTGPAGIAFCCPSTELTPCPSGQSYWGTASRCAEECTSGVCLPDTNNVASCCKTTDDDGKTKFNLWDLIKRKEEIDLGFITISTDPEKLAADILELGIGVGALLAVLFTIIGGFGVATSSGDPDKLEKAKSQITAAVSGMVFLLASALILKYVLGTIIGVDFF